MLVVVERSSWDGFGGCCGGGRGQDSHGGRSDLIIMLKSLVWLKLICSLLS